MATLINDKQTWQKYCQAYKMIANRTGDKDSVPAEIRSLYERETPLTASDLSSEFLKEILVSFGKTITGEFKIDKNNENAIDLFIQYLRKDEAFLKVDPFYRFNKGLLLIGPVGTGKTILFKALRGTISFLRFFNTHQEHLIEHITPGFQTITANDIVHRFSLDGYLIFQEFGNDRKFAYMDLINKPLLIDDIGSEPESIHFGAKTNILSEVIIQRYEKGSLTHATSNMGIDSLQKTYGLRTFDRLKEMFNDISLTGESRRH